MKNRECNECAFYFYADSPIRLQICTFYDPCGQLIKGCLCGRRYYLTNTEAYDVYRRFAIERAGAQPALPEQEVK